MRLIAFGESFVQGAGDPDHLGWVGRAISGRREISLYNLGIRRETSTQLLARWEGEAACGGWTMSPCGSSSPSAAMTATWRTARRGWRWRKP
uniref:SGNH hydrolase-type esterase domain-containing protein n=1 Tax=Phenylobacterium glaciei TaxID=2803784 RepID=A0A974P431_9CAUL|nr:hypothetical protein JKL49_03490 [Phenylobacterium glaciei]